MYRFVIAKHVEGQLVYVSLSGVTRDDRKACIYTGRAAATETLQRMQQEFPITLAGYSLVQV